MLRKNFPERKKQRREEAEKRQADYVARGRIPKYAHKKPEKAE